MLILAPPRGNVTEAKNKTVTNQSKELTADYNSLQCHKARKDICHLWVEAGAERRRCWVTFVTQLHETLLWLLQNYTITEPDTKWRVAQVEVCSTSAVPVGSIPWALLPFPLYTQSCKLLQVLLPFVILQLNHSNDNENNITLPCLDCEGFYSCSRNTCLLAFLPQNTSAIFWPGHQASRGWLEMHFQVSVEKGLFQLVRQPTMQAGWN